MTFGGILEFLKTVCYTTEIMYYNKAMCIQEESTMSNNPGSKKPSASKSDKDTLQDKAGHVVEGAEGETKSSAELLSATIQSGVELIASVIDKSNQVKEDLGCVVCKTVPKAAAETAKKVSKAVSETLDLGDSNSSTVEEVVSREEFDLLKLDVIKLKTQMNALLKQKK